MTPEKKKGKERVDKQKIKRREVTEKKKLLKEKKKQEKDRQTEKEMWGWLRELNKEFKEISGKKEKAPKMSKTILKM